MSYLRFFILLIGCSVAQLGWGQVLVEDFSDANFTSNPVWVGDVAEFSAATAVLQSKNSAPTTANSSYLSTVCRLRDTATWEFWVNLGLAPSTSNYAKIYLAADGSDLEAPLQGYFLRIGGMTGAVDSLELRWQNGTATTKILGGSAGAVATNPIVRVRISRSRLGVWTLWADYTGGSNLVQEAQASFNSAPLNGSFFGVNYLYTSTNATRFGFDDLRVSPLYVDLVAPKLLSATPIGLTTLDLLFDEPLEAASANTAANYSINGGVSVASALLDPQNTSLVHLTTSAAMTNLQNYTVTANAIKDLAGNALSNAQANFRPQFGTEPQPGQLYITEIMSDPSPTIGLPDREYLEIYNNSSVPLNLTNVLLTDATGSFPFPSITIPPSNYYLVCSKADTSLFKALGVQNLIPMSAFPSLNNTGEPLTLRHQPTGRTLDSLYFLPTWHATTVKQDGGWSLEMRSVVQHCKGALNWTSSENTAGGTPGAANSPSIFVADNQGPKLLSIQIINNQTLVLKFDEPTAATLSNFSLSGFGSVAQLSKVTETEWRLTLPQPFTSSVSYTLQVSNLSDCLGNATAAQSLSFTYYQTEQPAPFDVLINEILPDANPVIGLKNKEYVELYNRSNKIFNLKGWVISDGTTVQSVLPEYYLLPNAYVTIYSVGVDTIGYKEFGQAIGTAAFPDLNSTGDNLVLYDNQNKVLDNVNYANVWYQNAAKAEGGWSLERLSVNRPCSGQSNWAASTNPRGGTPGQRNSQQTTIADQTGPSLLTLYTTTDRQLLASFDEALTATPGINSFRITPTLIIDSFKVLAPDFRQVQLWLKTPLQANTIYQFEATTSLTDCAGNPQTATQIQRLELPQKSQPNQLIINELLFNPQTGGKRFIELYNNGDHALDLSQHLLIRYLSSGVLQSNTRLPQFILHPKSYIALTDDPLDLKIRYPLLADSTRLLSFAMPTYDYNEETAVLRNADGQTIDSLTYDHNWHNSLLDNEKGVSLERLTFGAPTNLSTNWFSAAKAVGYATPGYRNSQAQPQRDLSNDSLFVVEPRVFSPDEDGYNDFMRLLYSSSVAGQVANINLYDVHGFQIKQLARSELLATQGSITWDGATDAGQKAPIGTYIMRIELINVTNKTTQTHLREVTIATK